MGGKNNKKIPRAAEPPAGGKQVRIDPRMDYNWEEMPITWHFSQIDHSGLFGWDACDRDTLVATILDRARSFESMSWRELRSKDMLHHHPINSVGKEARNRLEEIGQDDIDSLYSLRIEKKRRVWGIRDRLYFRVLWWDPEHLVYAMNIKDN